MERKSIEENKLSRAEADRELRSYKVLGAILRSAGAYGRSFGYAAASADGIDEVAVQSQMYSIRALILSLDDAQERFLLYHYYIKGLTLDRCARLLNVSKRTVYRLKNRALDSAAQKLAEEGRA